MSLDIFLQAFSEGDGTTGDGEADVHGIDSSATGLMFNHVSGIAAFALLYDIARCAGFVVLPVGCPTCVPDQAMEAHLPPELAVDVVVIESGDDLLRAIQNA